MAEKARRSRLTARPAGEVKQPQASSIESSACSPSSTLAIDGGARRLSEIRSYDRLRRQSWRQNMNVNRISKFAVLLVASVSLSLFAVYAQTGNTGGSSGGTGGGQHGEGSGPAGSVPAGGGASYIGDPDRDPYASPTPTDITGGGKAEPSGTPKHHHNKSGSRHGSAKITPSPSPSR